ncbi:mitochondrial import receptor subunit TOM34 [Vitis riparia]|uniref:mitochondrial import receptor subunit TOM34 n=1 Tax=Vitis riparia TaxID=96939 RepID=UPI00155A624C|nr:mitochondrial import receptor subunit TOM34 [Vitis riparia]
MAAVAAATTLNKIERAHQMYREGLHEEALGFYTEALAMAKTRAQKIALHSNRAACYLKLHDFDKAAKECTSVLELDHKHTGALMLRAQTLVTLKEYHSALFDVKRLMELNPSSEVYRNLEARLKTQLSLAPIPESEAELEEEEEDEDEAEPERDEAKEQDDTSLPESEEEQEGEEEEEEDEEDKDEDETELKRDEAKEQVDKNLEEDKKDRTDAVVRIDQKAEPEATTTNVRVSAPQTLSKKDSSVQDSKGWQAIPKPKGHSNLDYSRWDRVEDDSSEDDDDDEDDDEESQPQYRFRLRTVGVRPVK